MNIFLFSYLWKYNIEHIKFLVLLQIEKLFFISYSNSSKFSSINSKLGISISVIIQTRMTTSIRLVKVRVRIVSRRVKAPIGARNRGGGLIGECSSSRTRDNTI